MITRRILQRRAAFVRTVPRRNAATARQAIGQNTAHPQGNSPFPQLLQRDPDRPLPSLRSLSATYKWMRTLPIFFVIIATSALGIFNYQKVNSPVITATLYGLRTNQFVRDTLGNEVYFASKWAWIWGEINLVQGRIDVKFRVKGTRRQGWCRFRARRMGGRSGQFQTLEWSLTPDDGEIIQLLDSHSPDPLQGATF